MDKDNQDIPITFDSKILHMLGSGGRELQP